MGHIIIEFCEKQDDVKKAKYYIEEVDSDDDQVELAFMSPVEGKAQFKSMTKKKSTTSALLMVKVFTNHQKIMDNWWCSLKTHHQWQRHGRCQINGETGA